MYVNKVTRLSTSPHQMLDMMIQVKINDSQCFFTVSRSYYEEKTSINSKGEISEWGGVDNLVVSLYKCM